MNNINNPTSKRILMIAQSVYDYDPRILRQTEILKKNNFEVHIICFNFENKPRREEINGCFVYRIMKKFYQDKILFYIINSLIFIIKSILESYKLSKKFKFDYVQIHNMPDYLVFSAIYFKLKKIPIILDVHDLTPELFKEKWGIKKFRLLKPLLEAIEKISILFSDKVITVSEECKIVLKQRNKKKEIMVLMNTPDLKFFPFIMRETSSSKKKIEIIYHGTIAERYGIFNLLYTLKYLIDKKFHASLTIIGNFQSSYGNSVIRIAKQLEIDNNVNFNSFIPYNHLSRILRNADYGLVLPEITEYFHFGVPTKVFEYVASGLPVIVSQSRALKSIFREESLCLVNPHDYALISDKIIELTNDKFKREVQIKSAFEDLQKISFDIMSNRYLNLFKSFEELHN